LSDDVVSLTERRLEPCPGVVKMLEDLLERARKGDLRSIAIAAEEPGGFTSTAYHMGDGDVAHLVLPLFRLQLELARDGSDIVESYE